MADEKRSHLDLPPHISLNDPWLVRHHKSSLLEQDEGPAGSGSIYARDQEVFGNPSHPIRFRVGNGGAGFSGILRRLSEAFIRQHGNDFCIGWVPNHSRHTQIALLADIVQVALTYEPHNEQLATREGWSITVGRAFNDHFILAGPKCTLGTSDALSALRAIAARNDGKNGRRLAFHTRADGSATYAKEMSLWAAAGVDFKTANWIDTYPLSPYEALVNADKKQAFLLTDRCTYLTAKRDGAIRSLEVHAEGEDLLLNPCTALVRVDAEKSSDPSGAATFARWLQTPAAQHIIHDYGRDWPLGRPLFTIAAQDEFEEQDLLMPQARGEDKSTSTSCTDAGPKLRAKL